MRSKNHNRKQSLAMLSSSSSSSLVTLSVVTCLVLLDVVIFLPSTVSSTLLSHHSRTERYLRSHHHQQHHKKPHLRQHEHRTLSEGDSASSAAAFLEQIDPHRSRHSADETAPAEVRKKCSSCVDRELFKNFTRIEIRDKILRKLGMYQPPNVTVDNIPKYLVNKLMSKYGNELGVQGDQGFGGGGGGLEDDDSDGPGDGYHIQTKQINVLAKSCKYNKIENIDSN